MLTYCYRNCPKSNRLTTGFALMLAIMLSASVNAYTETEEEAFVNKVEAFLTASADNGFSGAVMLTKNGKQLLAKGYGYADKKKNILNSTDTVFDIASLTKQFTAAAILKLVEQNKLSLTDTLGKLFSDVSNQKRGVTIHQLLTHSAGFEEYSGRDFDPLNKEDFLKQVLNSPLEFSPGSDQQYSNVGFGVLAAIIELQSGLNYEIFLQRHLFKPSGMKQTGYLLPQWKTENIAHAYRFSIEDIGTMIERYQRDGISWNLYGNGGIHSTMLDLHRWDMALNGGKILSKESLKLLYKPHVTIPDSSYDYSYGWRVKINKAGSKIISFSGDSGLYYSVIYFLPNEGISIFFSTNVMNRYDSATWVAAKIGKMIFEPDYQPKPVGRQPILVSIALSKQLTESNIVQLTDNLVEELGKETKDKGLLNGIGIWHLNNGDTSWAIAIFKLNIKEFSDDGNLWDSLGEAYLISEQVELAKKSFEKAISLAPEEGCYWCENSRNKLKKLN
jgi:CubicO group peptidase (beta-lactamase class C family)